MGEYGIIVGDNRETIKNIKDHSVDCIITSPPYFGLRKYKGDSAGVQIGAEAAVEIYITNLVTIFSLCWSKLKHNGTLWVNLGDSLAGSGGAHKNDVNPGISKSFVRSGAWRANGVITANSPRNRDGVGGVQGCKPKDLVGIPYRVALALRDYGWYWRAIIPWVKASAMPQSALDRPTIATEYWLMFSKSKKYYYDQYAILAGDNQRFRRDTDWFNESLSIIQSTGKGVLLDDAGMPLAMHFNPGNARWEYCEHCDTLYRGKQFKYIRHYKDENNDEQDECYICRRIDGWVKHYAAFPVQMIEPIIKACTVESGTVLDPFSGTASTGIATLTLNRNYIGCELSEPYAKASLARMRSLNQSSDNVLLGQLPLC